MPEGIDDAKQYVMRHHALPGQDHAGHGDSVHDHVCHLVRDERRAHTAAEHGMHFVWPATDIAGRAGAALA